MDVLVDLLREDAALTMPPQPSIHGARAIADFFGGVLGRVAQRPTPGRTGGPRSCCANAVTAPSFAPTACSSSTSTPPQAGSGRCTPTASRPCSRPSAAEPRDATRGRKPRPVRAAGVRPAVGFGLRASDRRWV